MVLVLNGKFCYNIIMSSRKRFSKPYRVKRKKALYKNRYFWFSILLFLAVGGLGYLGFFDSMFQIKDVQISGNAKISGVEIQDFISQSISSKFAFLASKSIFLLNSTKISQNVLQKYLATYLCTNSSLLKTFKGAVNLS